MKKLLPFLPALLFLADGCATRPPTFVETMEPGWTSVELAPDLAYDQAWEKVSDLLARRFDLAVTARDSGYLRTNWIYTWTGTMTPDYKVRAAVKFTDNRKKIDIKAEAQYLVSGLWRQGTDTQLLETLKSDIMGVVSRTTR